MQLDFNCDLGEGLPNDAVLMQHISSCNIACGGHAGNVSTIDTTIDLALKYGVKIGAHPSFPDKQNFGRKFLKMSSSKLQQSIEKQLQLFLDRLKLQKGQLHHVKPHGALYNSATKDKEVALAIVKAVKKYDENTFLYVPFNSEIERVAKLYSIKVKYEVFVDRNYNDDGSLVARSEKKAVIHNKEFALEHIKRMALYSQIKTVTGKLINTKADTFCIHGDNITAVEILQYLNNNLDAHL